MAPAWVARSMGASVQDGHRMCKQHIRMAGSTGRNLLQPTRGCCEIVPRTQMATLTHVELQTTETEGKNSNTPETCTLSWPKFLPPGMRM